MTIVRSVPNIAVVWEDQDRLAMTCLLCGRTSWNPNDAKHLHCGACGDLNQGRTLADAGRECFDPWPGLSPFAQPTLREEIGLPASWWTRPTRFGALRCRWGFHDFATHQCGLLLDSPQKIMHWSGGYPFAFVDGWKGERMLVRIWYDGCDRCGSIAVPDEHSMKELHELLGVRFQVTRHPRESTWPILDEVKASRS